MANGESGFTVLEALIAFAITSLVLVGMFEIFSSVSTSERRASEMIRAVAVADDRVAQVGTRIAFEPGEIRSEAGSVPEWRMSIEAFEEEKSGKEIENLYRITIVVLAADGTTPVLEVSTAKYKPPR